MARDYPWDKSWTPYLKELAKDTSQSRGHGSVNNTDYGQDLSTTGSPTFHNLTLTGTLNLAGSLGGTFLMVDVENLAAGSDISNRPILGVQRAYSINKISIITKGTPSGVDDSNTVVVAVTNQDSASVVSKTYNTANQPPTSDIESLGSIVTSTLAADGYLLLSVTCGTTANMPAFSLIIELSTSYGGTMIPIQVENLAAGSDITNRVVFGTQYGVTLSYIGIITTGAPSGVDDSNTVVITLTNGAGTTIITKTYNTATQPPTSTFASLGSLSVTSLAANDIMKLTVTCGATANMPAFTIIVE